MFKQTPIIGYVAMLHIEQEMKKRASTLQMLENNSFSGLKNKV